MEGNTMRYLILGASGLVLTACSFGGSGYGLHGSSYGSSYGGGYSSGYTRTVASTPSASAYGTHAGTRRYSSGLGLRGGYGAPRGHMYGSIGAVLYDLDESQVGVQARLGYQTAGALAAEVEGSLGLVDDETVNGAITTNVGTDYSVGAFGKATFPLWHRVNGYGRFGYHGT